MEQLGARDTLDRNMLKYWPDHYSHSQSDQHCGRKLWYRYLDERKLPSYASVDMMIGNAVEAGVNYLLRLKMGVNLKGSDIKDAIALKINLDLEKGEYTDEDVDKLHDQKGRILEIVEKYEALIDYKPLEIQKRMLTYRDGVDRPVARGASAALCRACALSPGRGTTPRA